mmetsp:Transcript_10678/g.25400  ORF Transcript_10678/g.25400 Transcript_10678/m.25400 type:complete len:231 (+) Transcript_10678:406-1098(+)
MDSSNRKASSRLLLLTSWTGDGTRPDRTASSTPNTAASIMVVSATAAVACRNASNWVLSAAKRITLPFSWHFTARRTRSRGTARRACTSLSSIQASSCGWWAVTSLSADTSATKAARSCCVPQRKSRPMAHASSQAVKCSHKPVFRASIVFNLSILGHSHWKYSHNLRNAVRTCSATACTDLSSSSHDCRTCSARTITDESMSSRPFPFAFAMLFTSLTMETASCKEARR